MANYALSVEADADVERLAESSLEHWGLLRTETYLLGLHATFQRLAEFPEMGRDVGHIRPGIRKLEAGSHSVFYRKTEGGILVVRVLHQRMDVERHLQAGS